METHLTIKPGMLVDWLRGDGFREPRVVQGLSEDGKLASIDGLSHKIPVVELQEARQEISEDELKQWAQDVGQRFSVRVGVDAYRYFKDEYLTPENAAEKEAEYLKDIEDAKAKAIADDPEDGEGKFMRRLLRTELYYLVKFALGYDLLRFDVHYPMCRFVNSIGPGGRFHGQAPRATYKTTIWTIGYSVQHVIRNPNVLILIKSHEEEAAKEKAKEARERMHASEMIQTYFPEYLDSGARVGAEFTCPARTIHVGQPTIRVAGGKQGKVGGHYDVILADDMWDGNAVRSTKTLNTCFKNVRQLRYLRKGERVIQGFIDTRWSHDDPTTWLRRQPEYQHFIVSAIDEGGNSIFSPQDGAPGGFTLRTLYADYLANSYEFFCQMMNNPTDEHGGFSDEWFRWLSYKDLQKAAQGGILSYQNVMLVDMASTTSDISDENALIILALDSWGRRTVAAVYERTMTPRAFMEFMLNTADRFHVRVIGLQKQHTESHQLPEIYRTMRKRASEGRPTYQIHQYRLKGANQNKDARMRSLMGPMEDGTIYFNQDLNEGTKDMEKLIAQLQKFPHLLHDDLLDCLSMQNDPVLSAAPQHRTWDEGPTEDPITPADANTISREFKRERAAAAYEAAQAGAEYEPF